MKMPKLKIRLPKMKLTAIFRIVFALIVVVETLLLYKSLYLDSKTTNVNVVKPTSVPGIDLGVFRKTAEWLKNRANFQLPTYELREGERGRENPFSE